MHHGVHGEVDERRGPPERGRVFGEECFFRTGVAFGTVHGMSRLARLRSVVCARNRGLGCWKEGLSFGRPFRPLTLFLFFPGRCPGQRLRSKRPTWQRRSDEIEVGTMLRHRPFGFELT